MTEGGLKRENVHAPLHSVCGMAVPQLVWVNVEPCCPTLLSTNISNRLSSEMSLSPGTRKYIAVSFAAARDISLDKRLEMFAGNGAEPQGSTFTHTS